VSYAAVFIFLLALAASAYAQGNMTIDFKTRSVRNLAGVVAYTDGTVISGAIVADCDSTFGHVLASTKTDATGHFTFPHAIQGSRHYLKIDFRNYQEVHMPVKISPFSKSELRIWLTPGT
jgi:hypothetical protein